MGVGVMYLFHRRKETPAERLTKKGLPYTLGMVALDILAPIFLMLGIAQGNAANASLLGNFEIAATRLIALLVFHEAVSKRLWAAIALISLSSMILSFEGADSFQVSRGSAFILLAAACWGLENNCTRSISSKSTHEIVVLKGFFSGGGSFLVALALGETLPGLRYALAIFSRPGVPSTMTSVPAPLKTSRSAQAKSLIPPLTWNSADLLDTCYLSALSAFLSGRPTSFRIGAYRRNRRSRSRGDPGLPGRPRRIA